MLVAAISVDPRYVCISCSVKRDCDAYANYDRAAGAGRYAYVDHTETKRVAGISSGTERVVGKRLEHALSSLNCLQTFACGGNDHSHHIIRTFVREL
jgi:hypothetical protein